MCGSNDTVDAHLEHLLARIVTSALRLKFDLGIHTLTYRAYRFTAQL